MNLTNFLATSALILVTGAALAHERITLGPSGGRVIYLDSPAIPHVEVIVNSDNRASITLLDADRKPMTPGEHVITVTAGQRSSAKKLQLEKQGDKFISEPVPDGAPYTMVIQIKGTGGAKALTARLNYDPAPRTAASQPISTTASMKAVARISKCLRT
jgi:hypothetical protein